MTLVKLAIASKVAAEREEKRGRGAAPEAVWCVFDRDEHPQFEEALELANANGVRIAFSNPCFELWLLLHYQDQVSWLDRASAQSKFKAAASLKKDKQLPPEVADYLVQHNDEATRRAQTLDALHAGNGSPKGENPSSTVWRLIDSIRNRQP